MNAAVDTALQESAKQERRGTMNGPSVGLLRGSTFGGVVVGDVTPGYLST